MMESIYFLSMNTENTLCVLHRIATVFTRNRVNIEQMNVFETARKGVSHFTIVVNSNHERVTQVIKQLRKVIEVIDIQISNRIPLSQDEELPDMKSA